MASNRLMDVGKVHQWLQVGCLVGGLAWIGGKMDARLVFIESAQKTYMEELITIKKNQQHFMGIISASDTITHQFTGDHFMVVTDPSGKVVRLVINKQDGTDETDL